MPKIIFVGESPSQTGDGTPLSGSSGKFLSELCGIEHTQFLQEYGRYNMFAEDHTILYPSRNILGINCECIILLGKEVSERVLGRDYQEYRVYQKENTFGENRIIIAIPHPSRKNRYWNASTHRMFAKQILSSILTLFR